TDSRSLHDALPICIQSALNRATAKPSRILVKLQDKNQKLLAEKVVTIVGDQFEDELQLGTLSLWSPENPTLYDLQIVLLDNANKVQDALTYQVGFRHFHFDEKQGFSLNGKPYKLFGVCLHHDLGAL